MIGRKTTAAVAAGFVLALGATAPAAHASGDANLECAKTAHVLHVAGSGFLKWFGPEAPSGARWHGDTMRRQHFYELHGVRVRLRFGGDVYKLSHNAIVHLSCSGVAVGDPLDVPNLDVLKGQAVVRTTKSTPGSVLTEEGLFSPVPGSAATRFVVKRGLTDGHLTMDDKINWYAGYSNQPRGTSRTATKTTLPVNVTPYVGKDPGTCRHTSSARLTTKSTFGHGSATYG